MSTLRIAPILVLALSCVLAGAGGGCTTEQAAREDEFHTSGSREADQRAEQRMSRTAQLRGEGGGSDGAASKQRSLYERLGGERGVAVIVGDFVDRALADPRVNWERRGVRSGGVLGVGGRSAEWNPSPANVERMKVHLREFIAVASGGPTTYGGREIEDVHDGMGITNAEFDAAVGDLKATLDTLRVPAPEQKELLAVLESTRPQIAEER